MKVLLPLLLVGALLAPAFSGACDYPKAPEKLPDGSVATLEEMVSGQKAVKEYDKQISDYLACLKTEYDAAITKDAQTLTAEKKEEMARMEAQKHNAAVDELEGVANRFNEQVKVYKARSDKSKS